MESVFVRAQRVLVVALVFFVVLAIFPLTPSPAVDLKVLGYELAAFVALALWLFAPRPAARDGQPYPVLFWTTVVFVALNFLAALASYNPGYSLGREFVSLASLFILFLVAADLFRTPRQTWMLIGALCLAVSLASLYGLAQFLGYDPFPWGEGSWVLREAPATFGNPNVASHVLAPALILACALAAQRRGRWAAVCVALFLGHFALTQTRGSLLALSCAAFLVFLALLAFRKARTVPRAIAFTLGALLVTGLLAVAGVAVLTRAQSGQVFPDDNNLLLRAHSSYEACRMVQDRPLLGYGPGMYEAFSPQYWTALNQDRLITLNKMNYQVHNEPLQFAVEAGLAGGIVYVAILALGICYGLLIAFRSDGSGARPLGLGLAAFFLAFLVDGLFGFNAHVPVSSLLLFLLAGATVGLWRGPQPESAEPPLRLGWGGLAWRVAVLAVAAVIPVLAIREFAAQVWQKQGIAAMEFKADKEALESFHKAATLAPHHWLPPYYMGLAAAALGDNQAAQQHYARALALNPNYVPALINRGKALLGKAAAASLAQEPPELRQAFECARHAALIIPQSPEVQDLVGRATLLHAQGLAANVQGNSEAGAKEAWRAAENQLLKAVDLGGKHKDQLFRLVAVARFAQGDTPGGQQALALSLREKPDDMETWRLFLQASQRMGRYDDLRSAIDWGLERLSTEDYAESRDMLRILHANILYAGYGDAAGAEAEYRAIVDARPDNAQAWAAYHAFAKVSGQQEGFRTSLAQAIAKLDPASPQLAPQLRAVVLIQRQGEDSVITGVSTLMDALQQHQAAPGAAGTAAEQFAWALDVLTERAKQESLSPENAGQVYFRLGLAYGACRDFNTAAELLGLAAQSLTGPQLQECLMRRAAALAQAGNTATAVQAYENAVANDAASIDARYALAQALAKDGQRDRARQEFESILNNFEINPEGRQAIQQAIEALSQ